MIFDFSWHWGYVPCIALLALDLGLFVWMTVTLIKQYRDYRKKNK